MGNSNNSNKCVFCDIVNVNKQKVVYENNEISIFPSRSPIADIHLLSVPKIHTKNINSLTRNDIGLLQNMTATALKYILDTYPLIKESDVVFGLHIPPFNSVEHIHMHVLVPPYVNCCTKFWKVDVIMRSYDKVLNNLRA